MTALNPTNELFQYQKSAERGKNYKLRTSKRKRLFEYENSSDDEVDHVDKKVKIVKPPVNGQMIFKSFQGKEYEKCLDMIDEVMREKPKEDAIFTQFKIIQAACWTLMDMKKEETENQLMLIIKKDPKNSFAHYGYGLYQYHEGQMAAAIEWFGKAIDLNPTGAMKKAMELKAKAKSLMDMLCDANAHYKKNNCARAVDMLNAALLIDPENRKMIKSIVDMRDSIVKDLVLRLEKEIENDFPDKVRDAEKLMIANQMAKAEKVVNEINVEEPNTARAFYIKGKLLYLNGSLTESHKLLTQALQLNAKMEKAILMEEKVKTLHELVESASKHMVEKDYPAAIETFTKAIEFDADNKFICQASHFQRALANFNIGNFDEAFEDYKSFELMKKVVGNVLQDIEVPNEAKDKREEAEKKTKAQTSIKKKKKKNSKKNEEIEVKQVSKLETLNEEEEFEHDSFCEVNIVENVTESEGLKVFETEETHKFNTESAIDTEENDHAVVQLDKTGTKISNGSVAKVENDSLNLIDGFSSNVKENDNNLESEIGKEKDSNVEIVEKMNGSEIHSDCKYDEVTKTATSDEIECVEIKDEHQSTEIKDEHQSTEIKDELLSQDYGAMEDAIAESEQTKADEGKGDKINLASSEDSVLNLPTVQKDFNAAQTEGSDIKEDEQFEIIPQAMSSQ